MFQKVEIYYSRAKAKQQQHELVFLSNAVRSGLDGCQSNRWTHLAVVADVDNVNANDAKENIKEELKWPRLIIRFEDRLFYPQQGWLFLEALKGSNYEVICPRWVGFQAAIFLYIYIFELMCRSGKSNM